MQHFLQRVQRLIHASIAHHTAIRRHALVLLLYMVLSIGLSWPLLGSFTTHITGTGHDALHNLWMLWHTQQAVAGNEPLFSTNLLYYPYGATLLTTLGPLTGFFALPFWAWGPAAALNGSVLVSLCLTGYCMYLLARGLNLAPGVAFFAGVVLLSSGSCMAGLLGHMTKVFLGGIPLALLTFHHTLNPRRSPWWALATALVLLLTLLHVAYHFIFAGLGMAFFLVAAWLQGDAATRRVVFRRTLLLALCSGVVVGPLIVATLLATRDPQLYTSAAWFTDMEALMVRYQPDLVQFVVPNPLSQLFGATADQMLEQLLGKDYGKLPENFLSLAYTGIVLCLVAATHRHRRERTWLLFLLVCLVLSLGPFLKVLGQTHFTKYDLPLMLPYALLTSLPGLGFMRASGRFMQIGFVAFGIAASFGLARLLRGRTPRQRPLLLIIITILVLLESWPVPMERQHLTPVPPFYQQLAQDEEVYGVFDLPVTLTNTSSLTYSSLYQYYQITHHKGIAAGYLARIYYRHPLFSHLLSYNVMPESPDFLVNSQPTNPYINSQALLSDLGYRYVVWHQMDDAWAATNAANFVEAVFGDQEPVQEDAFTRVYAIDPVAPSQSVSITPTLAMGNNWHSDILYEGHRWATSPATLVITSPYPQCATLQITPARLYDPQKPGGLGEQGTLTVQTAMLPEQPLDVELDATTSLPLSLSDGTQTITLSLEAGNFRPIEYGGTDPSLVSFAIRSVNLQIDERPDLPVDLLIAGEQQPKGDTPLTALYCEGWYSYEAQEELRWARSPAQILINAQQPQRVRLRLRPALLHGPRSANGLVDRGTLQVSLNRGEPQHLDVHIDAEASVELDLEAGANVVTMALEAGNFEPHTLLPTSEDRRTLSFAVSEVEIIPLGTPARQRGATP